MNSLKSKIEKNNYQIVLLEAESNYTFIHLENGDKYIVSYNIGLVENKLKDKVKFIRPNRKFMINEKFVNKTDNFTINALGRNFIISRRRKLGI
jgi:DNA-binding LytR/AlgR family response regulator